MTLLLHPHHIVLGTMLSVKGQLPGYPDLASQKKSEEPPRLSQTGMTDITKKQRETPPAVSPPQLTLSPQQQQTESPEDIKNAIKEGEKESIIEMVKKQEEDKQKVEEVINTKARTLYSLKTVFPFDFFPDEITIEDTRVHFSIKSFYLSTSEKTVAIKDIYEVQVSTSLFFATMTFTSGAFHEKEVTIRFFKKEEALYAKRLIEGLKLLEEQEVDTSLLNMQELKDKIEKAGETNVST